MVNFNFEYIKEYKNFCDSYPSVSGFSPFHMMPPAQGKSLLQVNRDNGIDHDRFF